MMFFLLMILFFQGLIPSDRQFLCFFFVWKAWNNCSKDSIVYFSTFLQQNLTFSKKMMMMNDFDQLSGVGWIEFRALFEEGQRLQRFNALSRELFCVVYLGTLCASKVMRAYLQLLRLLLFPSNVTLLSIFLPHHRLLRHLNDKDFFRKKSHWKL